MKNNNNHMFSSNNPNDLLIEIENDPPSPDRNRANNAWKKIVNDFISKDVKFLSFISIPISLGLKKKDMTDMVEFFISNLINADTFYVPKRERLKANKSERNMILNCLALQFPNELKGLFRIFINNWFANNFQNFQLTPAINNLIEEFCSKVDQLQLQENLNSIKEVDDLDSILSRLFDEVINEDANQLGFFNNESSMTK